MVFPLAYGKKSLKPELIQMAKDSGIKVNRKTEDEIYDLLAKEYKTNNFIDMVKEYNKKNNNKINIKKVLKPSTPGFYLSNSDIDDIFDQFANVHEDFMSYGAVPYDFWKRPEGSWKKNCDKIYGFSIEKFVEGGKRKWGMVCNTQTSNKGGSHWVCMYFECDPKTKKATLEYFDSIGTKQCRSDVKCTKENIPTEIKKFTDHVEEDCKKHGYDFKFTYNKKQHQQGNNECGMYCVYYIYNRILGADYSDLTNVPDEKMTYLRHVLFLSPEYCWKCKKYKKELKPLMDKYSA